MTYERFKIEVRMLRDTWTEFVPKVNETIPDYDGMSFKEKAIAHINQYNEQNEFPKQIVSFVARNSSNGEWVDLENFYGLCIDPDGDIWKVGYCDHKSVVGFGYEWCKDWILTVNPKGSHHPRMCIRLVPNKVGKKALKTAMRVVERSSAKKFLIETILTNAIYKDMGGARSYGFTKVETLKRLSTVDELDLCILGLNGVY